ncbi:MAG: hypothetical protein AAB307_04875 [Deltaproteobacteria bacterium]
MKENSGEWPEALWIFNMPKMEAAAIGLPDWAPPDTPAMRMFGRLSPGLRFYG